MKMTAALYEDILNTAQDCIFWKDKERRFVGANRAFLDFYGFETADVLIGRTDEDMGWHNDPEPFKQDELRVLAGESTYKVQGKCMVKGEERDIIASKRPLYEGDKIVGLVGSFRDVTEVLRKASELSKAQRLYSREQLQGYDYFDRLLEEMGLEGILDPLTDVISRAYILDFANYLISAGIPFSFTILDLDNFKYINDTYGHHAGDAVLMDISKGLAAFTEGYGVVGRFGGDELLIINLRDITYSERESFFERMYRIDKLLRKNVVVDGETLFVTGTSGCAAYPENAKDYDTLFALMDKLLYQGKNRGRNCYVNYDEKLHKDIEIKKTARHGIYTSMHNIILQLDRVHGFESKLKSVMLFLMEEFHINEVYYVGRNGRMHSVSDTDVNEYVGDISSLVDDEVYLDNEFTKIEKSYPELYKVLKKHDILSVMIVRIGVEMETDGFLICAEHRKGRIWQEDECAIMYFLSRYFTAYIRFSGDEI